MTTSNEFGLLAASRDRLLLDLIHERMLASLRSHIGPDDDEESDERSIGYVAGWWDAIECHSNIVDSYIEGEETRTT